MVGDNPETDVAGANKRGWKSLLVRSGVYGDWPLQNEQVPTKVVDNIYDAVKLIKANLHC
jgi:ribonucleotide monophosphatase NagD (HAD superfamily)